MGFVRNFTSLAGACAVWFASCAAGSAAKDTVVTTSGLPVPRYVSLKSDHVNVRAGPTKDQDVTWIYTRSGLPVEITAEFENWRRVRDFRRSRGLGLSFAAVGQAHGRGLHEEEGRSRADL